MIKTWGTLGTDVARQRRPRGLVQEIVNALTASIREGAIKPDEKLPSETEIMGRFSVSRTVVREAISKLQAAGLVETRHGIGTFALAVPDTGAFTITGSDFSTIVDVIAILELRISLETEAAALAAERRTDANLVAMEAALNAFADACAQESETAPSDFEFHMEVSRATGNRHFKDLMGYLGAMIIPRTRVNTPSAAPEGRAKYLQHVHQDHEKIFDAIRRQDAMLARTSMRAHLSSSLDRLRRAQTLAG